MNRASVCLVMTALLLTGAGEGNLSPLSDLNLLAGMISLPRRHGPSPMPSRQTPRAAVGDCSGAASSSTVHPPSRVSLPIQKRSHTKGPRRASHRRRARPATPGLRGDRQARGTDPVGATRLNWGAFEIHDVPTGPQRILVWQESVAGKVFEGEVVIRDDGEMVKDFFIEPARVQTAGGVTSRR